MMTNTKRSEWRLSSQYFGDNKLWQVYYLRDVDAVDHAGNRVYAEGIFETREEAAELAAKLNAAER